MENLENINDQPLNQVSNQKTSEQSNNDINAHEPSDNKEHTEIKDENSDDDISKLAEKCANMTIDVKTSDNKIITGIPGDILLKSKLLSGIYEDYFEDTIVLNEIDSKNFELVMEYVQHYKNMEPKEIPKPFPETTDEEFFRSILNDDWTYNFLTKLNISEAIKLINGAYYLQMDGLINLLSAKLAHEMCNCPIEEARRKFGIESDMTEEEIAEIDQFPF